MVKKTPLKKTPPKELTAQWIKVLKCVHDLYSKQAMMGHFNLESTHAEEYYQQDVPVLYPPVNKKLRISKYDRDIKLTEQLLKSTYENLEKTNTAMRVAAQRREKMRQFIFSSNDSQDQERAFQMIAENTKGRMK